MDVGCPDSSLYCLRITESRAVTARPKPRSRRVGRDSPGRRPGLSIAASQGACGQFAVLWLSQNLRGGHALAAILFGDANPSGKLPVSFPKRFEDSPAYGHYPGENLKVDYAEGVYVGYRYYDTKNLEPQFPFGFGLSYTNFVYQDINVVEDTTFGRDKSRPMGKVVTVTLKNAGPRAGAEVVELYIHDDHSKIDRPAHELKGFARVELKPGESKQILFRLDRSAFSYWSPKTKDWVLEPGTFEVQVGASSRDIRLHAPAEVQ